jgi:hypothetical protein
MQCCCPVACILISRWCSHVFCLMLLCCAVLCCAVLFGDIGRKAAGRRGRNIVYGIIYSLDATRCVILHLAATQSLQHALGDSSPPMWQCGLAVMVMAAIATQVRLTGNGRGTGTGVVGCPLNLSIWHCFLGMHISGFLRASSS